MPFPPFTPRRDFHAQTPEIGLVRKFIASARKPNQSVERAAERFRAASMYIAEKENSRNYTGILIALRKTAWQAKSHDFDLSFQREVTPLLETNRLFSPIELPIVQHPLWTQDQLTLMEMDPKDVASVAAVKDILSDWQENAEGLTVLQRAIIIRANANPVLNLTKQTRTP